jgi:hypothetical protein
VAINACAEFSVIEFESHSKQTGKIVVLIIFILEFLNGAHEV